MGRGYISRTLAKWAKHGELDTCDHPGAPQANTSLSYERRPPPAQLSGAMMVALCVSMRWMMDSRHAWHYKLRYSLNDHRLQLPLPPLVTSCTCRSSGWYH